MSKTIFSTVALCVLLAACSPVAESTEYLSLQTELEEAESDVSAAEDALADAENELAALQSELDTSEALASDLGDQLAETEELLAEATSGFTGEGGEPYPEIVRAGFIEGCAEDGDLEACECMVDYLEQEISLEQFVELSLALTTSETGEGLEILVGAAIACGL